MSPNVTLIIKEGKFKGKRFTFNDRTTCIVGRDHDCSLRLPDDADHQDVSRHHCFFDINPPLIRIRDLGSMNGTWVNGVRIGRRAEGLTPEMAAGQSFPDHELVDGDEVRVGDTVFVVGRPGTVRCAHCQAEAPAGQAERMPGPDGQWICPACRVQKEKTVILDQDAPPSRQCANCGRLLTPTVAFQRRSDFLCDQCQTDVVTVLKTILVRANKGVPGLKPLKGLKVFKALGRGSVGAAFLARRGGTRETLALKIMFPEVAVQDKARKMFMREVENSRALNHPNVVRLFDWGSDQGVFFYTMEYCDGGCLAKLREARGGKVPLDEATALILQALDGLHYIHQADIPMVQLADGQVGRGKGLVHRDLKPANIFLAGSGTGRLAKIADVGVAKAFETAGLSGQTRTGSVGGTPVFMPRQQVVNFKYATPDVDVWAMAATYYNLLTGQYPRDFPPGRDIWLVVLQTQPVPILQRDATIPRRLAEVIDQALIDQPAITFKSAAEFKKAIEDVL